MNNTLFDVKKPQNLFDEMIGTFTNRLTEADDADSSHPDSKLYRKLWEPAPENKPQQEAYACEADEIFYGGRAGGGKTDLGIGKGLTQHKRTTIFRRIYKDLRDIVSRTIEIVGHTKGLNQSAGIWRDLPGGRMIEFGAMQLENDKFHFKGRGRDCYVFDEAGDFSESQVLFVTGWLRTTDPTIKPQVLLLGNPPTTTEGEWLTIRYAAWLDPKHPNPARPGELRWYVRIDDKETEVPDDSPVEHKGETLYPKSRTFIPASLKDNPYITSDYMRQLQNLHEPLRSQLLYGDFSIRANDPRNQTIPTGWVIQAQQRWTNTPRPSVGLRALANDPARGGKDNSVIAELYATWFDELKLYPGKDTPDGDEMARLIFDAINLDSQPHNVPIGIDVIGIGSSVYDATRRFRVEVGEEQRPLRVYGINASAGSKARDKSGKLFFLNLRAQMYWQFREALDPSSGENICLPNDRRLLAELCAPKFVVRSGKIQIEEKDAVSERLGRSPDRADAVVMAWYAATYLSSIGIAFESFDRIPVGPIEDEEDMFSWVNH